MISIQFITIPAPDRLEIEVSTFASAACFERMPGSTRSCPVSLINSEIKCALSEAYLCALASVAGYPCSISTRRVDMMGIDARIDVSGVFGPPGTLTRFGANIQLKATSSAVKFNQKGIYRYEIERKNYDEYRLTTCSDLQLLILLVLPQSNDVKDWLTCSTTQLAIKGCAYWLSLYGAPDTTNESTITVSVRKTHRLDVAALKSLINRFANNDVVTYVDN